METNKPVQTTKTPPLVAPKASLLTENSLNPKSSSKNKSVVLILILLILGLLALIAYLYYQNMQLKQQVELIELDKPSVATCEHNGQTYEAGEGFTASDGCNSCSCSETGEVACTAMACLDEDKQTQTTDDWSTYQDGLYNYSIKYPNSWFVPPISTLQRSGPNDEQLFFIQANAFMNECMKEISKNQIQLDSGLFTRKDFQGIVSGEMCTNPDNLSKREVWIQSANGDFGFVYTYDDRTTINAEETFDQILSTFEFTE